MMVLHCIDLVSGGCFEEVYRFPHYITFSIIITFPFHLMVKYFLKVDGILTSIG